MTILNNPFVTSGYISAEYFCDREKETDALRRWLKNENNVAIISTRRMGKTGLIEHYFHSPEVSGQYHTFLVDIYATKTLRDFVFQLGKAILNSLKPKGQKAWELFLNTLVSVRAGFSLDLSGLPSWNIELGDIKSPAVTLDEIFHYLEQADKPCIVATSHFRSFGKGLETEVISTLYKRYPVRTCTGCQFFECWYLGQGI